MNFRCKFRHRRSIRWPRDFLLKCNISAIWRRFRWFSHIICWMSALFLLPVCLAYWPRKFTTRVAPHVDNSHQVWSWYNNQQSSYSVFVCWYVTWPCDLDLWPFGLEQMSYMPSHVSNLATKYEDTTPIQSSVMSYNVSPWLPLKVRTRLLRMRRITWPVSRGQKQLHFGMRDADLAIYYATSVALRWK